MLKEHLLANLLLPFSLSFGCLFVIYITPPREHKMREREKLRVSKRGVVSIIYDAFMLKYQHAII
jgi:hypothetical protein